MLNRVIIASTLLFFSIESPAQPNCKAEILRHGIYAHSTDNGKTWINPISDNKITSHYSAPVHLETTENIPPVIPLFFGFEYQIRDLKDKMIDIQIKVTHPEMKNPDGETTTGYSDNERYIVTHEKIVATTGYLFEENYETTPGHWQFNIMIGKCVALQQNFTVMER